MSLPPVVLPLNPEDTQGSQLKKSWVSVAQNKSSLSKHHLDVSVVDGNQTVKVPDDIFEDSAPLWEDFLIGKFLATTAPHVAKIHVIVNKIWPLGDKSVKIDVFEVNESTVKFRIRESHVRERVLRRGMWNIAEVPMVVSKWSPIIEEAQPDIKTIPMWVVIKHVPHKMFTWKGLGFIASAVGDPKRLHPDTVLCKSFDEAKVFVEADLSKELPHSFRFQADNGVDAILEFKYPWLPPKCSTCAKWGHLKEVCVLNKGNLEIESQDRRVKEVSKTRVVTESSKGLEISPLSGVVAAQTAHKQMEIKEIATSIVIGDAGTEENEEISTEKGLIQNVLKEGQTNPKAEKGVEQEKKNAREEEGGWSFVSPTQNDRNSEKKHIEEAIVVSPSRFSVLEVEEEEDKHEKDLVKNAGELEVEEGEIENHESSGEKQGEQSTRPSLPRVSKASR